MIDIVILGAGHPNAGELIRLLINHPEIGEIYAVEPSLTGTSITARHHGLAGETNLKFTALPPAPDRVDLLMVFGDIKPDAPWRQLSAEGKLKIISVTDSNRPDYTTSGILPAISEIYRKNLVRGAMECTVLPSIETITMIMLYPTARNLLLNAPLTLQVSMPHDMTPDIHPSHSAEIISDLLASIQQSFRYPVTINLSPNDTLRTIKITATIANTMAASDMRQLYESIYDDHNFTFCMDHNMDHKEVEGTNKCLITLTNTPSGNVNIEAIADAHLRGGAGDALHALNLMFGLHERTGLALKALNF